MCHLRSLKEEKIIENDLLRVKSIKKHLVQLNSLPIKNLNILNLWSSFQLTLIAFHGDS